MNRNRLFPILGVAVALLVLFFIFFASRPDPDAEVVGDGGGLDTGEEVVPTSPDDLDADE